MTKHIDGSGNMQHYRDMLALSYHDRDLIIEVITSSPELGGKPTKKGLAFHQHSRAPIITEDGVSTRWICDQIVLDINQIIQLRNILNTVIVRDSEGNEYGD